jgi:WxL interacting protein linking bacterial and host surfaces
MLKPKLAVLYSVVTFLVLICFGTITANAATSTSSGSGDGLTISPLTTNLLIDAGQSQTTPIFIQNVTNSTATIQVEINDFTAGPGENGHPALLLNSNQYAPSHSLKRYIAPISDITLAAGQQKTVNVSISIPKGIGGGGYYAAVRFTPVNVSNGKTVTLTASVASLILVRVPGNVIDDLQLASIDARQGNNGSSQALFLTNSGLYAGIRFNNAGNVQEQPFGKLVLKSGNKELATYVINNTTPAGNVLPGSIRLFTVKLTHVGMFGKYTLLGNFGYGTNGQLLSGSTTFYVIPTLAIVIAVVMILLIVFFIYVFLRKRHDTGSRSSHKN